MTKLEKTAETLKIKSMTKKALREYFKSRRVKQDTPAPQIFKSKKKYNRPQTKKEIRQMKEEFSKNY